MRENRYLLVLMMLFFLAGCGNDKENIQNTTETNSAVETNTEKNDNEEQKTSESQSSLNDNDNVQLIEELENDTLEKVVTSTNQAIDLVYENITAGGGLKLTDKEALTAEELTDGYLVHVNSDGGTSEMGRYKVFFDGKIIPGIVLSTSDAKLKVIETIKNVDPDFTQEKYDFLITPVIDNNFVVTVTLKEVTGASEQEKNNQGDYTIGPDGVVTNHKNKFN